MSDDYRDDDELNDDDGGGAWRAILTTRSTPADLEAAIALVTAASLETWHEEIEAEPNLTPEERERIEARGAALIGRQTRETLTTGFLRLQQPVH